MAYVVHPPIDFTPRPVNHAPSPFGFGFGLSSTSPWSAVPGHAQSDPFQQLASTMNQAATVRIQKRRHEPEDDDDTGSRTVRDDAMDRSPTPERPKRAVPKRIRITPTVEGNSKDKPSKDGKATSDNENDVDVGMLLTSLPSESLLSLVISLLNAQPSLKSTLLTLIPRPTLESATHALAQSAKKLRDAYPYSNTSPFPQVGPTTSVSFDPHFPSNSRSNSFAGSSSSSMGFGKHAQHSLFDQVSTPPPPHNTIPVHGHGNMRESYIMSRLRPHIEEFVSACMTYLPYFSYSPDSIAATSSSGVSTSSQRSYSSTLQRQHRHKLHPSETYAFLAALTSHLLSQPSLTQSALSPLLLPRLEMEWRAWVDRVDSVVNKEGGMFGGETVKGWERGLDEFAEAKGPEGWSVLREVRDQWVSRVGWLVGRMTIHAMES